MANPSQASGPATDSAVTIETRTGAALEPLLPDLAHLRITVFREFPYLYDGDAAYEARYLRRYIDSPRAGVVVALAGGRAVGAATCIPLADETDAVRAPFLASGLEQARFFYFGESVLLRPWRGRGIGVAFFAGREAHARAVSDCDFACFCAVRRPADHPARPADYVPLDVFWRRRGYTPYPDLACRMTWKDIGESRESGKELTFWMKPLRGAALP